MKDRADGKRELFPNLEVCCTQLLHPLGLVECLVKSPERCPYALAFGGDFFCQHPDGLNFAKPPPTTL